MRLLATLSLTTPLMLWGVALVALPLIAHLFHRRARRRVIFPTIQLLQKSAAAQSKMFKLRRWLMLALRCLLVALIAAAFARPLWFTNRQAEANATRGSAVVIVLDASASTSQEIAGGTQFESLRASASRLLEGLRSGSDVADVVVAGDRPTALFPRLTPNVSALQQQLRTLKPGFARADLPKALAVAGELLATHSGTQRILILSDLQQTNWQDSERQRLSDLFPPGAEISVVEPASPPPGNIALSNPRTAPPRPLVGQPAQCIVRVSNFSATTQEVPLSLRRGTDEPLSQTVQLAAGEEREVGFSMQWSDASEQTLTFSIAPDALAADNTAALVTRPVQRLPVLVVGDEDPQEPGSGAYFLLRSLAPLGSAEDRFDVRVVRSSELTPKDLEAAGVVFVEAIAPNPARTSLLATHLKTGGGLVVFGGDPSMLRTLQSLNSSMGSGGALPWTPGPTRELTSTNDLLTISGGQWRSRLLRDFDEQSQLALSQIHFRRILTSTAVNPEANVLLTFSDGSPALASRQVGSGQLLVAAFSADAASSDFAKFGSFVALMQLLARELRPAVDQQVTGIVGQLWRHNEPVAPSSDPIQLVDPVGGVTPFAAAAPSDGSGTNTTTPSTLLLESPDRPGVYRFERGGKTLATATVQIDPRESRLDRIDKSALERLLQSSGQTHKVLQLDSASATLSSLGKPLWHWVLVAALVAIAVELACLARWPR
jgi:hypothetical protein